MVWKAAHGTNSNRAEVRHLYMDRQLAKLTRCHVSAIGELNNCIYVVQCAVDSEVLKDLTSQTTFLVHRTEGTHVVDDEAIGFDGRLEALEAVPGHVPEHDE